MAQFKRFNTSENNNWNSSYAYPQGTLTWDPDNGLRIHDGDTAGGNQVGGSGFSGNFYDLSGKPYGNTAVHDLRGGSSSDDNGKFLKQTSLGVSEWMSIPTTYDTLTIGTKVTSGLINPAGTQITGITATLGSGAPYNYAFLDGNSAFGNLFDRGSSIIGWKMYPADNPSAFVTITEYLNFDLGGPSLGFDGALGQGPWIAESPDYSAGTPGPLVLSAGTKDFTLGADGVLTLPTGGDIVDSNGDSVLSSGSSFSGSYNDLTNKPTIPSLGALSVSVNTIQGGTAGQAGTIFTKSTDFGANNYSTGGGSIGFLNFGTDDDIQSVRAGWTVTFASGESRTVSLDAWQPIGTYWNISFDSAYTWGAGDVMPVTFTSPDYTAGSDPVVVLSADNNTWTFDNTGNLTIPSSSGGFIKTATNGAIGILAIDGGSLSEYPAQLMAQQAAQANPDTIISSYTNRATIQTDVNGTMKTWTFDEAGKLTLPAGGDIVDSTGTSVLGGASGGSGAYVIKDANFTAEAGKTYWLNSGTSPKTMTLPASPAAGDWVKVYDGSMNWPTYSLTVNGNGNNIKIYNIGGGTWGTAASTATYNQSLISPAGPFPIALIWDGTDWYGAI